MMKLLFVFLIAPGGRAMAENVNFDKMTVGVPPVGWDTGVTGSGTPKWTIEEDSTAPSKARVLKQSGEGTFPWCVKQGIAIENGFVEVKFKALGGKEDQAGGVVWRFKDKDNYYVARANALENNVSLYYVEKGKRKTIKYVDSPVPPSQWHTFRAEFSDKNIKVILNGKKYIDLEDSHITSSGAAGVWTKADSITSFDDFNYGGK